MITFHGKIKNEQIRTKLKKRKKEKKCWKTVHHGRIWHYILLFNQKLQARILIELSLTFTVCAAATASHRIWCMQTVEMQATGHMSQNLIHRLWNKYYKSVQILGLVVVRNCFSPYCFLLFSFLFIKIKFFCRHKSTLDFSCIKFELARGYFSTGRSFSNFFSAHKKR